MYIQEIIGELLYIGIVAEKGRCYGTRWKIGYKKILKKHIIALNELQQCLQLMDIEKSCIKINEFILICEKNAEIGKFYKFSNKKLNNVESGKNYINVNRLINIIFNELLVEVKKTFINKRKVYDLLCALHNLPRVYLGKDKETLCKLEQESISEQEAIEYLFENMNTDMRKKYQNL